MDKESCSTDPERRDKAAFLEAARTLDPSSLFAYWPRGDSGTSAATNALFGAYGAGNPLVPTGRGSYGGSSNNVNVPSSAAAAYGNTLSVAASQAASLGINPASAAWWTVASHLAAQDYLARLHGMSFAGLPGAEALYPNFLLSPTGHNNSLSGKSSSKSNSTSSSSSSSKTQSLPSFAASEKEKENWVDKERDKARDRERERDRIREREKEREREREREREKEKAKDALLGKGLGSSSTSGSKTADHLASIAALANSGTTVSPFPPQAHSSSSGDSMGVLGGVRLPPDTEIIKYTSSIGGPKIPGTTNRGRKKTISLDPPSVSVMPTHSSTGIPIDFGQPFKSQNLSNSDDHVEVIKLPAHSSSNGIVPPSTDSCDEAPLNLCTKSRDKDDSNSDKDRISRRKPVPKQRRPVTNDPNPITSLSAMSQLFAAEMNASTPVEEDIDNSSKDGRPRNLGRGVSKPKKNTVASLLAQSRALGLKGSLPGDFASQLAALKTSLPPDISSQLALLQNIQSTIEDVDGADKRSLTPDNAASFDDKSRVKTSDDGSFTTDSASTGDGSDSESENGVRLQKSKKEKKDLSSLPQPDISIKPLEKVIMPVDKFKDEGKERRSPQLNPSVDEQFMYTQEINKQKELLYAVELEKERRRQHMILVRSLENRKRIEERERKRIELRAEKIAKHEKRLEQRRLELELLKELRRPTEDMELDDLKPLPEISRIPGLKLSGQAFADTLMVFEFLHNFGETLGFDMDSLPTLNSLQGALLNDEENEEELLSIMTHLLVCAIEDPGIPNPARHITLLGQSLKQADITHTNISEILRIYLYANATGEVKALTGLNFERDREKKISEHHNLYGDEAQSQNQGKNAAFFENLYENPTYKLSEELKEKPFLALNPTTKSAILAFICNELLQNKAVLRQIEGSLETVILSRRERWVLDQSIRKLRCLHDRQVKYSTYFNKDKETMPGVPAQVNSNANPTPNEKEKTADGVDSDVESADQDSDHESEITQPEEFQDDNQQNLNSEEISKRLEKLLKQQESHLMTLRTSSQQIRAMCLGQDRYWRRYWCLPRCGSIFVEGMESAQPEEFSLAQAEKIEDIQVPASLQKNEETQTSPENDIDNESNEHEVFPCGENANGSDDSKETGTEKRKFGKRKGEPCDDTEAKKNKTEIDENSENNPAVNDVGAEDTSGKEQEMDVNETEVKQEKTEVAEEGSENLNGRVEESTGTIGVQQELKVVSTDDSPVVNENEKVKMEKMEVDVDSGDDKKSKGENIVECGEEASKEKMKEEPVDMESDIIEIKPEIKQEVQVKTELADSVVDKKPVMEKLMKMKDPVQEYLDRFKELTDKDVEGLKELKMMKEFLCGMGKNIENEAQLRELAEKFKYEDDPLLRAMKKELSSRIFGQPIKKEDFEEGHAYRNSGSPITNEVTICNSFTFPKETDVENYQWFSLLPKDSCDPQTQMLGKNDTMKAPMAAHLRVRAGLPPSPGPIPLCDSPAPLILSPDEAAMLERLKTSGPRPPPVRKPIPKCYRRGWWKVADENQLYQILECLHNRGIREKELKRLLARYLEDCVELEGKMSELKASSELVDLEVSAEMEERIKDLDDGAPPSDEPHSWDPQVFERVDNFMLEQVENLEDKVASASMQVKGWRVPSRSNSSDGSGGSSFESNCKKAKTEPMEIAKQRLISLESAIERRYLKPPLGFSTGEGGVGIQVDQDESIPKGLGVWREAVLKSHTAAQLSMALYMLESCIAWDKSIMKANCQFCQSGDNEDKLLLCDGCDRGYHMYCFKPKMDSIPDGDWYCHECKNKSNGEKNCIVCGKRPIKNFVTCEHCPRIYHADCLNPPLLKIPRAKWNCVSCAIKYPKKKCGRKVGWRKNKESKSKEEKEHHRDHNSSSGQEDKTNDSCEAKGEERSGGETDGEDAPLSSSVTAPSGKDGKEKECAPLSPIPSAGTCSNSAVNDEPPPLSPQQPTGAASSGKKERISKKICKELNACKSLVEEMELQDEAWPFLLPVNTKQFPTYKKIIKCPMDISTIKKRLTDGQYKTKEEFVYDVRQIFNNCETFNEDDSPVGKAGHAMRSFFETKWGELTNQKSSP